MRSLILSLRLMLLVIVFLAAIALAFAANDPMLDHVAQITSQIRESALHSSCSLQTLIGKPSKGLGHHDSVQLVMKSHQNLSPYNNQDHALFFQPLKKSSDSSENLIAQNPMVNQLMEEAGDLNQSVSSGKNYFNRSMGYLALLSAIRERGFAQSCYPRHCCFNPCSEKDQRLLEARLGLRTHYVGKYCSQQIEDGAGNHCIEEMRSYCIFPSVKARQIQEQGREQINKLAQLLSSSEHNAVVEDVYWPFKARVGRWHRYWVGGVDVALWSWPNSFSGESKIIFAVCQYAQQCGALALPPFKNKGLQEGWLLVKLPLEQKNWLRMSPSLYSRGKCIESQCHWQIKSMGIAGAPDTITSDLEWQIGSYPVLRTSTGIKIRPTLQSIQFKLPGKQPWRSFILPFLIKRSSARVMHRNPRFLVWGACEERTGHCHYYFSHQVNVHAISWGTPQQPNCRSLRPEELLWINWNDFRL